VAEFIERMSERARSVLTLAQEEARAFQHDYIGTEHLLLGLVHEHEGIAGRALANLGVEVDKARKAVDFITGRGEQPVEGEIALTPRSKKVLQLAVKEAKRLNHRFLGTEHILLGILEEGHGLAVGILENLGTDLGDLRQEVMRLLGEAGEVESRVRRYNLVLPDELYEELQQLADRQHTTVVEILRRFVKLGLLATKISESPGSALIIREGDREREILLL
jgi:ATP-dependent Clp protease ATP-binding subunit ClpC